MYNRGGDDVCNGVAKATSRFYSVSANAEWLGIGDYKELVDLAQRINLAATRGVTVPRLSI